MPVIMVTTRNYDMNDMSTETTHQPSDHEIDLRTSSAGHAAMAGLEGAGAAENTAVATTAIAAGDMATGAVAGAEAVTQAAAAGSEMEKSMQDSQEADKCPPKN